jgi:hypothetical protein
MGSTSFRIPHRAIDRASFFTTSSIVEHCQRTQSSAFVIAPASFQNARPTTSINNTSTTPPT